MMGFCLYNNVAVAAAAIASPHEALQENTGGRLGRAPRQWDPTCSRATLGVVLFDPSARPGQLLPLPVMVGLRSRSASGKGAGFNVNVGWTAAGRGMGTTPMRLTLFYYLYFACIGRS